MLNRRDMLAMGAAGFVGLSGAAAAALWFSRPALGFGLISLGQSREATLRLLGADALAAELCGGVDGALYEARDGALLGGEDRAIPAMAMFGGEQGAVSEIEASLSWADGGLSIERWRDLVANQTQELTKRTGGVATLAASEDDLGAAQRADLIRSDGTASLQARWMRRSGAAFTRLHWIAAGQTSVIT